MKITLKQIFRTCSWDLKIRGQGICIDRYNKRARLALIRSDLVVGFSSRCPEIASGGNLSSCFVSGKWHLFLFSLLEDCHGRSCDSCVVTGRLQIDASVVSFCMKEMKKNVIFQNSLSVCQAPLGR